MKNLRFGIIGSGAISHHHCLAISRAKDAEVKAIYSRNKDACEKFATKHQIEAFSDIELFLNNTNIDAVTIATPSGTHLEIATLAAKAGKHILCEKPLEVSSGKSTELIQICRDNNIQLGVFFQSRFDPAVCIAKKAISSGRLGKLLFASCQMRWYRSQEYYDSGAWRGTWKLDGGGCLMNQGIHSVDLLVHLAGEIEEVSGMRGLSTHEEIEVEDNLCASLRFKNGAIGSIETSTSCAPGFPRRLDISGEKGSICIEDNRIVRWSFTEAQEEDQAIIAQFNTDLVKDSGASNPMDIDVTGHKLVVEDFVQSIIKDKQLLIDGMEGKKAVDVVCSIYKSIKSGQRIKL